MEEGLDKRRLHGETTVNSFSRYQGSRSSAVHNALFSAFWPFFAIGILFDNLNAIAMRPLGQVAGLGASLIASGTSLVATLFAIGWCPEIHATLSYHIT